MFKKFFIVFGCLLMTSCSTTPIEIQIHTARSINTDCHGQALPVALRVYQLKDAMRFRQADFYDIWLNARQTLKDDLIAEQEMEVAPSKQIQFSVVKNKRTHYVGMVAIFRKPNIQHWQVVYSIDHRMPLIPVLIKIKIIGNRLYEAQS